MTEGGGQINIVTCVGYGKIGLEGCHIPRVEEALDFGGQRGWNGGSGDSARFQDDTLGRW